MFRLSEEELQNAFEALEYHGYGGFLPTPPEWESVRGSWADIRPELAAIDLDVYTPTPPLRVYAPKGRATVRVVTLLHPVDLLFYTALSLIAVDDIEESRIQASKRIVFSYRAEKGVHSKLYGSSSAYDMFRSRLDEKSAKPSCRYVAVADIADFYPRIYQHRLENVIESCAKDQRVRDVARVLVRKLIANLSGKNSYGIPVGPYASRVLAEAVLTDVDSFLFSEQVDFIRWVDDYYVFTSSEQQAQHILTVLAQRLYERHGLTLSALKTKILPTAEFRKRFDRDPDSEVDDRLRQLADLSSRFDPYAEAEVELSDQERAELAQIDIAEMVRGAIEDGELVDYETITALLRHPELLSVLPADARKGLAEQLLDNVEHLYPMAHVLAHFFASFAGTRWVDRKRLRTKLLQSLRPKRGKWPPDYYMIWILSLFSSSEAWRSAPDFARIMRDHKSEVVRRMAALAIAKVGERAEALEARDRFGISSPLEQLAILLATRKLGQDERKHWKTSLQLTRPLERRL